jgi:LysR family hydrogen peroxide-inducible transcriptional activator
VEIRQLQYFTTIATLGGFRRAADDLAVPQATLSQQIKSLERELGIQLFERSGRGLSLTEAGHAFRKQAERILVDVKIANEQMQEFAQLDRGHLVLGTVPSSGVLVQILAEFMRRYPHVDVTLVERTSGPLLKLLESSEIDVAWLIAPAGAVAPPPGICVRPLYERDLVVIVPPNHRLAAETSVTLEQIASERLILPSPEETARTIVDGAFRAAGLEPSVCFEVTDPTTMVALAAESIGIGITGRALAEHHAGRVRVLELRDLRLRFAVAVAWPERGGHAATVAKFVDFAVAWVS